MLKSKFQKLEYYKIGLPKEIGLNRLFYGIREHDFFLYEYSVRKGFEDRTMFNSPHFHFLQLHITNGDIWSSDYVNWLKANKRSKEAILRKVESFVGLYEDVRLNGVLKPITVFADSINYKISPEDTRPLKNRNEGKFPLYQTKCKDFEILWGHHRAACAAFLGYTQVKCLFYPSVVHLLHKKWEVINLTRRNRFPGSN